VNPLGALIRDLPIAHPSGFPSIRQRPHTSCSLFGCSRFAVRSVRAAHRAAVRGVCCSGGWLNRPAGGTSAVSSAWKTGMPQRGIPSSRCEVRALGS